MTDLLRLILAVLASLFKSRAQLEAENLLLRQQIGVLRRRMPKASSDKIDRLVFCLALSRVPLDGRRPCHHQTGDDHSLAPVLAQNVFGFGIGRPTIATGNSLSGEQSLGQGRDLVIIVPAEYYIRQYS
jgi:hypothetical protein